MIDDDWFRVLLEFGGFEVVGRVEVRQRYETAIITESRNWQ